jgi:hypothetical protein
MRLLWREVRDFRGTLTSGAGAITVLQRTFVGCGILVRVPGTSEAVLCP